MVVLNRPTTTKNDGDAHAQQGAAWYTTYLELVTIGEPFIECELVAGPPPFEECWVTRPARVLTALSTPVLSISGGRGITEGGTASFTITASPAPSSPITVKVGVSENGSFGASGAATVTVSGASTTYTISTTDDNVDEADGSVKATLKDGSGYTVSSTNGAATVSVADNDDAAPGGRDHPHRRGGLGERG